MFKTSDLENFLKEHEGEWWTPHEIKMELGADLRTVKKVIRRLDSMTPKGWRLVIAERGDRLYVVRMVRNIEGSENLIKAEISEVEGNRACMADFIEKAEAHWMYTEGIIRRSIEAGDDEGACAIPEKFIDLCRYLYVKGMVHGYAHGREDAINGLEKILYPQVIDNLREEKKKLEDKIARER